jgi:hypothetical protein
MKELDKKINEATDLTTAVNALLKWYEGSDVPFYREFLRRLPELIPSSFDNESLGYIDGGEADTIFTQQFPDLDGGNA